MFTEKDRYILNKTFENQYEILKTLRSINENIIKYCGSKDELEAEKLKEKMCNANFTKSQLEIIQEFVDYKIEKKLKGCTAKKINI